MIGEGFVKPDIIRRQFAKLDDKWIEIEDLRHRGLTAERTWSSFCVLIRTEQPGALATRLRTQTPHSDVDMVPSPIAGGVWVMGAHYRLESLLPSLTLLSAD
jgi:hypothetical protein